MLQMTAYLSKGNIHNYCAVSRFIERLLVDFMKFLLHAIKLCVEGCIVNDEFEGM
jgi:hypothetical protein